MITPESTGNCETRKGTKYTIEKWLCPICNQLKSTLYIDGEWCHGDAQGSHHYQGVNTEGCAGCILIASEHTAL